MNKLKKPSVYLETSTISFLASRPSDNPVLRGKQILTHQWWEQRNEYELFISNAVFEEIVLGDQTAANRRLQVVESITILQSIPSVLDLADRLLEFGAVPKNVKVDAQHIAFVAVYGIDFLVTWNQKHIASDKKRDLIKEIIAECGLRPPRILTPETLLLEDI